MITLVNFPAGWGAPSLSPFGIKAIYLLNASGLKWQLKECLDPRKYPQQKLPAIEVDGQVIGDSDNIRAYLAGKGSDLDAHLTAAQKAEAIAWQRLCEEHLYYQQVADRWGSEGLWPMIKRDYFGSLPFPVRSILPRVLRRNIRAGLNFLGHGRQSDDMRLARLDQDLHALATRLGNAPFMFGEKPASIDAGLAAMLEAIRKVPLETPARRRLEQQPVLTAYADRVQALWGGATS